MVGREGTEIPSPSPQAPGMKELRVSPGGGSQSEAGKVDLSLPSPHPQILWILIAQTSSLRVEGGGVGGNRGVTSHVPLGEGLGHLPWLCSFLLLVQAPALALRET